MRRSLFQPDFSQILNILERYQEESATTIARDFGVGKSQILRVVHTNMPRNERLVLAKLKRSITKLENRNPNYKPLTLEQTTIITKRYENGQSAISIGEDLKICGNRIRKILRKQGVQLRTHAEAAALCVKRKPKYTVNEDYFQQYSPEMFYILGLWFADGCITHNRNSKIISLSLKYPDKALLQQILTLMKSDHPLRQDRNMATFTIYSKKLYNDLEDWGCVPRKSLIIKFPAIPILYNRDFIRGYFDGDGCVTYSRRQPLLIRADITSGSPCFLESVAKIISKNLNIQLKQPYFYKAQSPRLFYDGKKAIMFLDWIYKDATLFLYRKRTKFLELCNRAISTECGRNGR